jgi:hypothetical protein
MGAAGCGPQVDCGILSKKLAECGTEVYLSISSPTARFLESLSTGKKGLSPDARAQVSRLWNEEKKKLVHRFVVGLNKKCARDKGRYRESGDLNRCLDIKDCKKFAECFQKAVQKKQ